MVDAVIDSAAQPRATIARFRRGCTASARADGYAAAILRIVTRVGATARGFP